MPATDAPTLERLGDLPALLQQAEGWQALVQALQSGQSGTVDGAWGSSAALSAATLSLQSPTTVLVVLAHPADLETWADELAGFSHIDPTIFPIDEATSRH